MRGPYPRAKRSLNGAARPVHSAPDMTKYDLRAWLISALALAAGGAAVYDSTRGMSGGAPCSADGEACGLRPRSTRSEDAGAELRTDGPRLLAFSSSYCPACERMKPVLADVERVCDARDAVAHVDVDRAEQLVARYDVSALPTFLTIDATGHEVTRLVGIQSRGVIERAVEEVRGVRCAARETDAAAKAL